MIGTVHIGEAFRMMRTEPDRAFPKPMESRFLGEQRIGAMEPFAISRGEWSQAHEEPVIADAVKGGVYPQSPGGRAQLPSGEGLLPGEIVCFADLLTS